MIAPHQETDSLSVTLSPSSAGFDGETVDGIVVENAVHDSAAEWPPRAQATQATQRRDGPRWQVAERLAAAILHRWPAEVRAIGVHGSLAHFDDREGANVDLVVVTYQPSTGPAPDARRIDGILVDLGVISAGEYLSHARTLSTSWPLAADQYLTTVALHDESGWHAELRDTHLARLAEASGRDFATLARSSWCAAAALVERCSSLGRWYDTDGALLVLSEARRAVAITEGLLTRTYFTSSADAVRKCGLAGADQVTVRAKLVAQAAELTRRGRPVDSTVAELLD